MQDKIAKLRLRIEHLQAELEYLVANPAKATVNESNRSIILRAIRRHFANHPEAINVNLLTERLGDMTDLRWYQITQALEYLSRNSVLEIMWRCDIIQPSQLLKPPTYQDSEEQVR